MRRWRLAALVAPALVALWATAASAHPLGNFTINHYAGLVVRPEAVTIDYVIDMAEIPAFQERSAIDSDADGTLSDNELAAYGASRCDALRSGLSLRIDGTAASDLRSIPGTYTHPDGPSQAMVLSRE